MKYVNLKRVKALLFFLTLPTILILKDSFGSFGSEFNQTEAVFIRAHQIESGELFLTDKVSDFQRFGDGYIIGERYNGSLLFLNNKLKPVKRIGQFGDGPNEMKNLGAIQVINDDIAVVDQGHARIVVMDQDGVFKNEYHLELLAGGCNSLNYSNSALNFTVPDVNKPFVSYQLASNDPTPTFTERKVPEEKNSFHARFGNQGFIQNFEDKYFFFSPMDTKVEVLNKDLENLRYLDFSEIEILRPSVRRARDIYSSISNQTIEFFSDVYQDNNRFYVLAYTDKLENEQYVRALNNVVEFTYTPTSDKFWVSSVIRLKSDQHYSQVVVEGNKLLAFNFSEFTIDEYTID